MNLNLKNKIFILVALPSLGLIVLIAIFMNRNFSEYNDAKDAVEYVEYSTNVSKLIHELQKERGKSALFLGGKINRTELEGQRNLSSQAFKKVNESIPKKDSAVKVIEFTKKFNMILAEARDLVDAKALPAETTTVYTKGIKELIMSQIHVAHNVNAFGDEKKLLSVTMLDMAKENAGQLRAIISYVLNADKPLSTQQINTISALVAGLNEKLNSPTLIITDKTRVDLDSFREAASWKKVLDTITSVINNSANGSYGYDANEYFGNMTNAIESLAAIIFAEQKLVSELIQKKSSNIKTSVIAMVFLSVALIALVTGLSVYFVRSITLPIQNLMEKLNVSSRDLNESSENVSASSELLSQNSTQQATALQETVSSLEEITKMIGKTADNAQNSQNVSLESAKSAEHGQVIVHELNQSIGEISDANEHIKQRILKSNNELEEISKIIAEIGSKTKIINDIVFQTKLLSFNASVEAARAGEQGKGFAVVAEEIGNLASMSGNAANEISEVLDKSLSMVNKTIENTKKEAIQIIEESEKKVEKGAQAAARCGQSLNEIVEKIQEVNKLVAEIATASNEQSQGMAQVSQAMSELDNATHSNSDSSVETAKSGKLLKAQAHKLNHAIDELAQIVYGQSASEAQSSGKVMKVASMKSEATSGF